MTYLTKWHVCITKKEIQKEALRSGIYIDLEVLNHDRGSTKPGDNHY